jgi:hypothetical protein
MLGPLRDGLAGSYPLAKLYIGREEPAVALGRLALHDLMEK